MLTKAYPELPAQVFVCPGSQTSVAEVDNNNEYELDETSNSYAWIGKPTKSSSNPKRPLSSDLAVKLDPDSDAGNHTEGMNVAYLGGSVEWILIDDLPEGEMLPKGLVDNNGERPKRP